MSKIPQGEWSAIAARCQNGESISNVARSYGCTPPAIHYILKRNRQRLAASTAASPPQLAAASAAGAGPTSSPSAAAGPPSIVASLVRSRPLVPPSAPRIAAPASAPPPVATPGLDRDLHHRAEAAIERFRTSFDAALDQDSPGGRAQLRQAAAELMRVAARTTIVLDRIGAGSERRARAQHYPRSAHARDDTSKPGPG
ncbi:MAG: hypothetical protein ACREE2_03995 [Stellaceae bacterium]